MIIDIRWNGTAPPEQIQHIRLATIYPTADGRAKPELVIHSYSGSMTNIPLADVRSITITND